jgi:hypothetical protein
MLEAIIAFFPIKEEHEAIGAIDYPIEVRKKYAAMSRKYKCDFCGPIVTGFPEKKKEEIKPENKPELQQPSEQSVNDKECSISEKEDNISDMSGKISQKEDMSPETKPLNKKTKAKKIDPSDRKSHVSYNVEGIIFEDLNEEEDEEEQVLNNMQTIRPETMRNSDNKDFKINLKENNMNEDFSSYLKQLRQNQFGEIAKEEKAQDVQNEKVIKQPETTESSVKNNNNIQKAQKIIQNPFLKSVTDEIEFYELQKNIKIHQSLNQDDIVKDLLNDKLNSFLNSDSVKYLQELNLLSNKGPSESENKEEQVKDILNTFGNNQRTKFEDLLKQKNIALKYFAKKTYREANIKRIKWLTLTMIALVILIFISFYYLRIYF